MKQLILKIFCLAIFHFYVEWATYSYKQVLILPVFVDVAKNMNFVVSKHNTIMYGILVL